MAAAVETQMEITPSTKLRDILERKTCSRCGGCGEYSYNQRDGTKCWGCNGTGEQLTGRGEKASQFYREMCQVEARFVRVGDLVLDEMYKTFRTVIDIEEKQTFSGREQIHFTFKATSTGGHASTVFTDSKVTVKLNDPVMYLAILKTIAEYQSQLTKAGKPRKAGRFGAAS